MSSDGNNIFNDIETVIFQHTSAYQQNGMMRQVNPVLFVTYNFSIAFIFTCKSLKLSILLNPYPANVDNMASS